MARKNRVQPGTPDAVIKAAKAAEKLHKEVYGNSEPEENTGATAEAQDASDGAAGDTIQPVNPEGTASGDSDTSAVAHEETPQPEPEPAPMPEPTPVAPAAPDFEQKYNVLQGKYNAEVPRMAQQIRDLTGRIDQLLTAPPKPAEPSPTEAPKKEVVSEEDINDYGPDLIDLIRRVALGEVSTVTEQLTPKIEEVAGQVQQSVQKQATTTVYSELDRDVQNWRTINRSAEFIAWLDQSDPYVGDMRSNLLSDAFQKGDAARVAAFFKGFLAEKEAVTPTPNPDPAPATAPAPQVSLEQLAGPAGGPSVPEHGAPAQPAQMWTRANITRFYQDVTNGVFDKDPDGKARIEQQIASAMKEGRVQ